MIYHFNEGAVPWRFNLLLGEEKKRFIKYCLDRSLPISDWYPDVTGMFQRDEEYIGCKLHEEQIVNFPLLLSDEKVLAVCNAINEYFY